MAKPTRAATGPAIPPAKPARRREPCALRSRSSSPCGTRRTTSSRCTARWSRRSTRSDGRTRSSWSTTEAKTRHIRASSSLAASDPDLKLVQLRRNFGQTAAMAAGFDHAAGRGDRADGRRPPERPGRHRAPASRRSTRATTSSAGGDRTARTDSSGGFPRAMANWLIGRVTGVRLHDYGCTLKAYRARHRARHASLRRDAPLPPGSRLPGGRTDRRGPRDAPPARLRPEQVRARADDQGAARPRDRQVPLGLVDEAELRLRRQRRRALLARHGRSSSGRRTRSS